MNSRAARTSLIIVGVIALLIGGVFAGQGLGLIPGSFMTGSQLWFYIGSGLVIVGIILVALGLRRPRFDRDER